jgi:predicted small lipoprotein YifL
LRTTEIALLLTAMSVGMAGCEKKGPLEEAGEAIDERIEDAREELEDAAGEVEQAAEEAREALRDR